MRINQSNIRWVILGLVWVPAIILSYVNTSKIETITKIKQNREIWLRDGKFWNQNVKNIKHILKKHAALTTEVESLKLGLFDFEDEMRTVSHQIGLKKFELVNQRVLTRGGSVIVEIKFQSKFNQAVQLFDHFETNLPHIKISIVKINLDPASQQASFEISVNYRFELASSEI